jgi:hypothetical protein
VGDAVHALAATCRCLGEDLGFPPEECDRPLDELRSHPVLADFMAKRQGTPIGQEVIQELAPKLIAYSLHAGRWRGATWHHEALGVVWLLAAAIHRADSARDSYPYFARLQRDGRLLPTREDIARVIHQRALTFAHSLVKDVPAIRRQAVAHPDRVQDVVLGGRVQLRVLYEPGEPAFLTVAVSSRLLPGALLLPGAWEMQLLAAFFPKSSLGNISYADDIGGQPLRPDERGYYDMADG